MNAVIKQRVFLLLCLLFSTLIFSQSDLKLPSNADPAVADELFSNNNFTEALRNYLALLKKEPKNEKYIYRTGICYLNSNINKAKAISYLETSSKSDKSDHDTWFYLGKAYHYAGRFDDALKAFTNYKESGKGSSDNRKQVDRYIQYCSNGKELVKFPLNVSFKNLGKNVNSPYPDYQAFVPEDESYLVFTTRRKEGGGQQGPDGTYGASVFVSKVTNGEFGKAKSIGPPINTGDGDEEVVGLSLSGDIMILVYDNAVSFADLFISYADKKMNFKKAEALDKNINSSAQEIAASISPDGMTLYFTSTRPGGYGGSDLYLSHKLPNGSWALAQNLGPEINTADDEDFPNISPDGETLYFSSTGHTSMGGYDIFKASWSELAHKWTNIKNIGYPINTPDDDMNLRLSANGKYGYIAALKEGGFGDLDIYRVDFNDLEPKYSLIKGCLLSADSSEKLNYGKVQIAVTDMKSKDTYGNYTPNALSGKYVMILPPGEYTINIDIAGFEKYSEKLVVADKVGSRQEIEKNIVVLPTGYIKQPKAVVSPGTKPKIK